MTYFELRPAINDDKAVEIQVTEEFWINTMFVLLEAMEFYLLDFLNSLMPTIFVLSRYTWRHSLWKRT